MRLFFVFLPTMLRQACQNFIVHVQTNNLTNKFFGKLINFSSFPHFDQKFSEVWPENFGRVVTTAFCVSTWRFFSISEGRNWGNFFPKKLHCYHFQTLNEKDPQCPLQAWLRQACQKSLYMFRKTFLQIGFLQSLSFFRPLQNSNKKFSKFWQEFFDRLVITSFYMYRSTIWGKIFFCRKNHDFSRHLLECERQICGFSDKTFWSGCQDCILCC